MTDRKSLEYYSKFENFKAEPAVENPLIDRVDNATLIAWFRCNSCTTCRWRKEVIDKDANPNHDIHFCSRMHDRYNIIDMVSYLGYEREGQLRNEPQFKEITDG